jgi:hypothetical protein
MENPIGVVNAAAPEGQAAATATAHPRGLRAPKTIGQLTAVAEAGRARPTAAHALEAPHRARQA